MRATENFTDVRVRDLQPRTTMGVKFRFKIMSSKRSQPDGVTPFISRAHQGHTDLKSGQGSACQGERLRGGSSGVFLGVVLPCSLLWALGPSLELSSHNRCAGEVTTGVL